MRAMRWPVMGLAIVLYASGPARAETTMDASHPYLYGANLGWIDAAGDGTNGAAIGQMYCTGYLWSPNCGWIGLGNGPADGRAYSNASAVDWGVNHDGEGRLSGYAYGANIGWVLFEQGQGVPNVDLRTGNLSGHVYGANVGWISLSNAQAYVRTARLDPGPDTDDDGLPDAWEYGHTNALTVLGGAPADADGDGVPDVDEYRADTDPFSGDDRFEMVDLTVQGNLATVYWTARPTRLYQLQYTNAMSGTDWMDVSSLLGPPAASPMSAYYYWGAGDARFYRVKAVVPLSE